MSTTGHDGAARPDHQALDYLTQHAVLSLVSRGYLETGGDDGAWLRYR